MENKKMTDAKKMDDLDAVRLISDTLNGFKVEDQQRIMRWVQEKLNIVFAHEVKQTQNPASPPSTENVSILDTPTGDTAHRGIDIRTFINSKKPNSDNQFAACVAYYYQFEATGDEVKEAITSTDLQDAARKAGRSRLGDPGKTLVNANAQGWLDKKARGSYAINTVGENLVAMTLPSSSSSESLPIKKKRIKKTTSVSAKPENAGKKRGTKSLANKKK